MRTLILLLSASTLAAQTPARTDTAALRRTLDNIASSHRGVLGYAVHNLDTGERLSHRLEVGMLWVNQPATPSAEMPFGGVKDSGYGSEGGPEAMEAYLVTKSVTVMNV